MSKIEQALNRARGVREGLYPVPLRGALPRPATGTALVPDTAAHPETISRMALRESRLLSPPELAERGIIDINRPGNPAVQVFRGLRTSIIQQTAGGNAVVLVTGVSCESGSSFVARNLGAAFAFEETRTALVIDCNFRSPGLQRLLANASAPGLTDYLQDPSIDVDKIIHPVGIARLRVIPAGKGPTRQKEFFTSAKMLRLMDSVRRRYLERFVILDGPPVTESADVQILSQFADFVLVVARYGRATQAEIDRCLSAVGDKKLTGIVFNDEPSLPWVARDGISLRSGGNGESRRPDG